MLWLLDGYNLMYQMGWQRPGQPEGELERRRQRFLEWLRQQPFAATDVVEVYFDAREAAQPTPPQRDGRFYIFFAYRQTADDLIEERLKHLNRQSDHPLAVVVSHDRRLRAAARRQGQKAMDLGQMLDWLERSQRPPPEVSGPPGPSGPPVPDDRPSGPVLSPQEEAELLRVFQTRRRRHR